MTKSSIEAEAGAEVEAEPEIINPWSDEEVDVLCKVVWGEAGSCSAEEQALVVWCVLNRVDDGQGTIYEVATAPYQFHGYDEEHNVEADIKEVVLDVLNRWVAGEDADTLYPYATTSDYLFFYGDGTHNYFREEW